MYCTVCHHVQCITLPSYEEKFIYTKSGASFTISTTISLLKTFDILLTRVLSYVSKIKKKIKPATVVTTKVMIILLRQSAITKVFTTFVLTINTIQ